MAPRRFVIDSPEAYERARSRMSEILDASDASAALLEAELTALTEACMDWEHATDIGSEANGPIDPNPPIASEEEYQTAKRRMAALLGEMDGTAKLNELARLSDKLEAWQSQNPPKTGTTE